MKDEINGQVRLLISLFTVQQSSRPYDFYLHELQNDDS